jgi:class 3 adenylate cyclase
MLAMLREEELRDGCLGIAGLGVHTGEVELDGTGVRGIAVHIGARVGAHAGPSEVLVSQTVKDLVAGSGLTFEDAGEHELTACADLDAEVAHRCTDRLGATDRAGRPIEGREEPVASGIHEMPTVTVDLCPSALVVTDEDRTPLGVAPPRRAARSTRRCR